MKIYERKEVKNLIGCWYEYYIFGQKVYTRLAYLYRPWE